ncbi:unnamed protein product [Camellia sinensis]
MLVPRANTISLHDVCFAQYSRSLTIRSSQPLTIASPPKNLSTIRFMPFVVAMLPHRCFILARLGLLDHCTYGNSQNSLS